jgi:hypothetical protein
MKGVSFKKLFNSATQNEVFLYLLLVAAVFNLLAYLQNNNLIAIVIFLVIGYATTFYTKNMTIVFLTTIVVTNLLVCMGYLKNLSLQEGFDKDTPDETDDEADDETTDETTDEADNSQPKKAPAPIKKDKIKESIEIVTSSSKESVQNCKDPNQHWDTRANECVSNTVNNETKKNANKKVPFSNLSEENAPLDGKPSINYKETVDTAFDQLGKILGKDGLDKMSIDTENLANKQDQLIAAMNKMEPMMNTAKTMMDTLGGLDIGNLLGGNFMKGNSKD